MTIRGSWTALLLASLFATAGIAQRDAAPAQTLDPQSERVRPIRSRRRAEPAASLRIEDLRQSSVQVGAFETLEISFVLEGGSATVPLWPYDPQAPSGVAGEEGVTAYAIFRHENGGEWRQPAFLFRPFVHEMRQGRDWIYPREQTRWTVRFSPHLTGRWSFTVHAVERSGSAQTSPETFETTASDHPGFLRVSARDPRYFEYQDGSGFYPLGMELGEHFDEPNAKAAPLYEELAGSGANIVRMWISSLYGSAWTPYIGGRNQYRGYLPNAGLVTVAAAPDPEPTFAMLLDWESLGDTGWFDACRLLGRDSLDAVLPDTSYLISAEYAAWGVAGPRDRRVLDHGLVIKTGDYQDRCYEPGTGVQVTTYGGSRDGVWSKISGVWQSGDAAFLPTVQIALENVTAGSVFIRSISVRELRADGSLGPEVLGRPSLDFRSYVSDKRAYQLDQIVELAAAAGTALKLVLSDKDDEIWLKLEDDGSFADGPDNADGYFGLGRETNATRWLQRAWWRYAQARWGYSPAIHSWELLNEGNPASPAHFTMADELARYMKYGVFGQTPPEALAGPDPDLHPNAHLVTTSFWHSFPCTEIWRNDEYRFLDYADLHAYVSTSYAGLADRERMQHDAALYHSWHSAATAECECGAGKPVMRGEAGMDSPTTQSATALGLDRDEQKLWLHNFVWATIGSGAMGEIYWWTSHLLGRDGMALGPFGVRESFLADTELNAGGYSDWAGQASDASLRVAGQRNAAAGRAHLWIQNRDSTWARAVAGEPSSPVSGNVVLEGFDADIVFRVEYWDTRSGATSSHRIRSTPSGSLMIPVENLATDVAVKVYPE